MKENTSIFELRMVKIYETKMVRIIGPENIVEVFEDVFSMSELAEEMMIMACLNTKNEVVGLFKVSQGSLNASIAHPREIFKRAVLANANSIILGHNHPSGDVTLSDEDINVTERVIKAGEILGIKLLDHVVMAGGDFISMGVEGII